MRYLKIMGMGVAATTVMTIFMLLAPFVGFPKMNVGELIGAMFGDSEVLGWIIHFIIGAVFALLYALIFNGWLPVINNTFRGALYGIIVFVFSEIIFTLINLLGHLDSRMKENMAMMIFGFMLACLLYGAVLGTLMKHRKIDNGLQREKKDFF
ncbi:MAG: DUF6789 family protein [Bacteroidota bacterium]